MLGGSMDRNTVVNKNGTVKKDAKTKPKKAIVPLAAKALSERERPRKRPDTAVFSEFTGAVTESSRLRQQLRELHQTVKAVRNGDFSVRMKLEDEGIVSEIAEVLNASLSVFVWEC